jgi:hypothetical protein
MDYKQKYLKYKTKYINLKKILNGSGKPEYEKLPYKIKEIDMIVNDEGKIDGSKDFANIKTSEGDKNVTHIGSNCDIQQYKMSLFSNKPRYYIKPRNGCELGINDNNKKYDIIYDDKWNFFYNKDNWKKIKSTSTA